MEAFEESDIVSVQFCVCFKAGREDEVSMVPVASGVQDTLKDIVIETMREWASMNSNWVQFEYAEQYPEKAKLRAEHASDEFDKIRYLYSIVNPPVETNLFDYKYDINYYLVIYELKSGSRMVGVRRARGLKALLSARNRIVQIIDDSLTALDQDVLKLDSEFDFVIDAEHVYILHSSGFESIAEVDRKILSRAREKALDLHERISFVDFTGIADHAAKHKRSARLVAAVWSRKNLDTLSATKVKRFARHTEVEFTEMNGVIRPAAGHEVGLLEAIDYRRYAVDIDEDGVKIFVATSRRRARRPPNEGGTQSATRGSEKTKAKGRMAIKALDNSPTAIQGENDDLPF